MSDSECDYLACCDFLSGTKSKDKNTCCDSLIATRIIDAIQRMYPHGIDLPR